jgi:RNA polymerase sigma factor (sigma-70 family)
LSQSLAEELGALAEDIRPDLHRYCARLTGSVFDGEDIVQDVLERALAALPERPPEAGLKPWLFRIAHNRALDHLRARSHRLGAPLDDVAERADETTLAPDEDLIRRETLALAVSRFGELPISQRSVVILKDVLDHSLQDIADLLDFSLAAVKAALHRGRVRLREQRAAGPGPAPEPSPQIARYVALFNGHDWQALCDLLAEDVRLDQSRRIRVGRDDVGMFFTIYGRMEGWHLWPAWLEGREIVAVSDAAEDRVPRYFMEITWRNGMISAIRDFRYHRYIAEAAEIVIASA